MLTEVEEVFRRRRGMIHNRERLNRRLMLIQLELNEQASLSHYSKVIRDELLANGGYGGQLIARARNTSQLLVALARKL